MSTLLEQYRSIASAPLDSAISLPFSVYHDKAIHQLESEKIFRNEWVFVCAERALPDSGDYLAMDLAGEAIAVIRGKDDSLRALSNNCRHRGTPLLEPGFGNVAKAIVCPYHAWSYDTQGALMGVPFAGEVAIDKGDHCLPEFHLDVYMGLVFVNLSDTPRPLADRFGGIESMLEAFEPQRFDTALPSSEEHWQANWKLAMENAMESYHLFKVHRSTLEQVTPTRGAYYVAGNAEWTLTGGEMKDDAGALEKWFRGSYPDVYHHYLLISLPPSFVGIMDYSSLGWISVYPTGSDQCHIRSGALTEGGYGSEDKDSQAFTEAFFAEDKAICERVQKGMYSQKGRGGKLVEMERVVVDFHQFLASRLFGSAVDPFVDHSANTVFDRTKT